MRRRARCRAWASTRRWKQRFRTSSGPRPGPPSWARSRKSRQWCDARREERQQGSPCTWVVLAILSKIHSNLGAAEPLAREPHCTVHCHGVSELHVAEERAAALAPVQSDLSDLPTTLKEISDHLLGSLTWQTTNPHCAAIDGLGGFRDSSVLSDTVCSQWLVLCKIDTNRHTTDRSAGQLGGLVYSLRFAEFHVAKLAVSQLIYLQTNHFHLATRLKKVNKVLFLGINGDVTNPKRVPIGRLDTFGLVAATAGSLWIHAGVGGCSLVHVGKVYLNLLPQEVLAVFFDSFVHTSRLLELHMSKKTPDMAIGEPNLNDLSTFLKQLHDSFLLRSSLHPTNPNCLAAFWLWATVNFRFRPRQSRWARRPIVAVATIAATSAAAAATGLPTAY